MMMMRSSGDPKTQSSTITTTWHLPPSSFGQRKEEASSQRTTLEAPQAIQGNPGSAQDHATIVVTSSTSLPIVPSRGVKTTRATCPEGQVQIFPRQVLPVQGQPELRQELHQQEAAIQDCASGSRRVSIRRRRGGLPK